jgi:hypothetical protein
MKLYPSERFTIEVAQPAAVVRERLRCAVETPRPFRQFRRSHEHPPFEGWIREDTFEISRIIHYNNSFLPIIEGQIVESNGHTKVHVKIAVLWAIVAFVLVIGLTLAGGFLAHGNPVILFAIGCMVVAFLAILYIVGWSEIRAAKTLLHEILTPPANASRTINRTLADGAESR